MPPSSARARLQLRGGWDGDGRKWKYEGEMNEKNQACGYGVATRYRDGMKLEYRGNFVGDFFEGVGK